MPILNMPDGTPVSFPDDMPKEQIKALIEKKFPDAFNYNSEGFRTGGTPSIGNVFSKTGEDIIDIGKSSLSGLTNVPNLIVGGGGDVFEAGGRTGNFLMNKITGQDREYRPTELAQEMITTKDVQKENPLYYDYESKTGLGSVAKFGSELAGINKLSNARNLVKPVKEYISNGAGNISRGMLAQSADDIYATSNEMFDKGGKFFNQMRSSGQGTTPQASSSVYQRILDSVAATGKLDDMQNPKYIEIINKLKSKIDAGEPVSIEDWHILRKNLTLAAKNDPDLSKPVAAKEALDKALYSLKKSPSNFTNQNTDAVEALFSGLDNWSNAAALEKLGDVVAATKGDPERIRGQIQKIIDTPMLAGRYTTDEINQLKEVAKISNPQLLGRAVGKMGVDLGTNTNKGQAFLSALTGVVSGSSKLPIIGTAVNYAQKLPTRGKLEKAVQMVQNRKLTDIIPNIDDRISTVVDRARNTRPSVSEPMKLLPAPLREMIADPSGKLRPMTDVEMQASQAARQEAVNLGLSPDIRNVLDKNLKGSAWDAFDAERKAIIQKQVEEAYKQKPDLNIDDVIDAVRAQMQNLSEAKGQPFQDTTMSQAFKESKPTLKTIIKGKK